VNVLLLTHRLPYAPNRGDRIRSYHLLRQLSREHDVSLLSLVHDSEEAAHAADVRKACADLEVVMATQLTNLARGLVSLPGPRPLTHSLLSGPGAGAAIGRLVSRRRPDVVVAYCSGMARYVFEPPLSGVPFVLDMVDVDSEKWRDQAAASRLPMRWIYAREQRTMSAFEARATAAAACTLVTNERERRTLAAAVPDADIRVVPNGIDLAHFAPTSPPASSSTVVFTGVMDYDPNVEAVTWLVREVWPAVRAARPDARFVIVGASPNAAVRALASADVTVTGSVPDTRPYLWSAAVAVAPLHRARGVQNKVLEAVSAGVPVVATPVVSDGLPAEVLPAVRTAGTATDFAAAVVGLLALRPEARRAISALANLQPLSWPERLAPVSEIVTAAAATPWGRAEALPYD
jgi:sugar transferase (PEP-CTERM/EpsH1 system associated)